MKYLVSFFVIFFLLIGVGIYIDANRRAEYNTVCQDKGGVPFRSKVGGPICIKKDSLL